MKYIDETLNERESTHGDYEANAGVAQKLKMAIAMGMLNSPHDLSPCQAESLDLICTKIGRIVSGDPNCPDHWDDIAGYANLVGERIGRSSDEAEEEMQKQEMRDRVLPTSGGFTPVG